MAKTDVPMGASRSTPAGRLATLVGVRQVACADEVEDSKFFLAEAQKAEAADRTYNHVFQKSISKVPDLYAY